LLIGIIWHAHLFSSKITINYFSKFQFWNTNQFVVAESHVDVEGQVLAVVEQDPFVDVDGLLIVGPEVVNRRQRKLKNIKSKIFNMNSLGHWKVQNLSLKQKWFVPWGVEWKLLTLEHIERVNYHNNGLFLIIYWNV
jgi:hypothetical protein